MCASLQVIPAQQSRLLKQSVRHLYGPSTEFCIPVRAASAWLHMSPDHCDDLSTGSRVFQDMLT